MLCEIAKRITYAHLSSNYPNVIGRLNRGIGQSATRGEKIQTKVQVNNNG